MPTNSGTSVLGLQLVGTLPFVANRFLFLTLPTEEASDRLEKVGVVLISFRDTGDRLPVAEAINLYGNGIYTNFDSKLPNNPFEVWVRWYRPGIGFVCQTRSA